MAVVHLKKHKSKPIIKKTNEGDMALRLSAHFDPRRNLIVPNVSWGLLNYEADMIVMSPGNVVKEIEIKVTRQDLRNDHKKGHGHRDRFITELYYAIPKYLENSQNLIPDHAGIIIVDTSTERIYNTGVTVIRKAKNREYDLSLFEQDQGVRKQPNLDELIKFRIQLSRLAMLRMWDLKHTLKRNCEDYQYLRRQNVKAVRIIEKLWKKRKQSIV